jgi:hypothetical protein
MNAGVIAASYVAGYLSPTGVLPTVIWKNPFSASGGSGRHGQGAQFDSATHLVQTFTASDEKSDVYTVGVAVFAGAGFTADTDGDDWGLLSLFGDGNTVCHMYFAWASNALVAYIGRATLIATATAPMTLGVWNYATIQVKLDDVYGYIRVIQNDVVVMDYIGDTRNGGAIKKFDGIRIGGFWPQNFPIDDLYVAVGGNVMPTDPGDVAGLSLGPMLSQSPVILRPYISAGSDALYITGIGSTYTLDGFVFDPNGVPVTVAWSKVSGPGTASFGDASSPTSTVTFSSKGTYVLRLSVIKNGTTYTDDVQIVIKDFTTVFSASFTAADSTLITAYTPEVGSSGINFNSSWGILGNQLGVLSGGNEGAVMFDVGTDTYDYSFDIKAGLGSDIGALVRCDPGGSGTWVLVYYTAGKYQIYTRSGSYALQATGSATPALNDHVLVRVDPSRIRVYVNGASTPDLDWTSTFANTLTKVGFRENFSANSRYDNLLVQALT